MAQCCKHDVPLLIAGDLFDTWKQPPELVNWVMEAFKEFDTPIYAIPGQHDLPNHRYEDIRRSCYWTLVEAGVITNLVLGKPEYIGKQPGISVWGFPWGLEVDPDFEPNTKLDIALIHGYIWTDESNSFPGANPLKKWHRWKEKLKGFDVCCFGDNHKGFTLPDKGIVNCGTLMRRKIDEFQYRPMVYLIYDTGWTEALAFDCSQDKFIKTKQVQDNGSQGDAMLEEVLEVLSDLSDQGVNFVETVKRACESMNLTPNVQRIIRKAIERKEDRE
jgi:DNA repair exonuclease SbcCD nuclease subunit